VHIASTLRRYQTTAEACSEAAPRGDPHAVRWLIIGQGLARIAGQRARLQGIGTIAAGNQLLPGFWPITTPASAGRTIPKTSSALVSRRTSRRLRLARGPAISNG
jgi:hypothetical protein